MKVVIRLTLTEPIAPVSKVYERGVITDDVDIVVILAIKKREREREAD